LKLYIDEYKYIYLKEYKMAIDEKANQVNDIRSHVREHYGSLAEKQSSATLAIGCCSSSSQVAAGCCGSSTQASSSCCGGDDLLALDKVKTIYETPDVTDLPEEVTSLSLGCGDPVTLASLETGQVVLDLGSGGGIDCFLAARQVGELGYVIGVDMTPQMIDRARANKEKVGAKNVEFRLGEIEHLPVADNSIDVVISNCVINLSPDKPQVFREAFRVLKPDGRLSVSDIVTDGPLPDEIKRDLSTWAGCVSGALDVKDYIQAILDAGFGDVELVPVYWDQSVVDEALEQLSLDNVNPEWTNKAVFSAKITARKPAGS
jgi:arsenite methyltransferase